MCQISRPQYAYQLKKCLIKFGEKISGVIKHSLPVFTIKDKPIGFAVCF